MVPQIQSALMQVLYVLIFSAICFLIRLLYKKRQRITFHAFIGFQISDLKFNKLFFLTLFGFAVRGALHTYLSLQFDPGTISLLKSNTSPYGAIIRSNSHFKIIMAIIYCYIQAGLTEEIFFRGLIAKRLYYYFGFMKELKNFKESVNGLFKVVFTRLDGIEEYLTPKLPEQRKKIGIKAES